MISSKNDSIEMKSENFFSAGQFQWKDLEGGLSRQVLGYDNNLMLIKVKFSKGAVGAVHNHSHSQSSVVATGSFEVEINGKKKILNPGDGFYVEPNIPHGVVCLKEGMIIDTFSPAREDFL
jgi:quercetin dioxygenase-like cupin family protein